MTPQSPYNSCFLEFNNSVKIQRGRERAEWRVVLSLRYCALPRHSRPLIRRDTMTEDANLEALITEMQELRIAARELMERSEVLLKKSDQLQQKILESFCREAINVKLQSSPCRTGSLPQQVSKTA
jgi:hypothetical protein